MTLNLSKLTKHIHPIETARRGTFLVFCLLVSSCSNEDQAAEDPELVRYYYQTHQEIVEDDHSPTGEWETHHRFPIFGSDENSSQINEINEAITAKIKKYSCSESGEETFTAEVSKIEHNQLTVEYEAMWMCSSMPSPEHTTGTLEFTLPESFHFAGEHQPE